MGNEQEINRKENLIEEQEKIWKDFKSITDRELKRNEESFKYPDYSYELSHGRLGYLKNRWLHLAQIRDWSKLSQRGREGLRRYCDYSKFDIEGELTTGSFPRAAFAWYFDLSHALGDKAEKRFIGSIQELELSAGMSYDRLIDYTSRCTLNNEGEDTYERYVGSLPEIVEQMHQDKRKFMSIKDVFQRRIDTMHMQDEVMIAWWNNSFLTSDGLLEYGVKGLSWKEDDLIKYGFPHTYAKEVMSLEMKVKLVSPIPDFSESARKSPWGWLSVTKGFNEYEGVEFNTREDHESGLYIRRLHYQTREEAQCSKQLKFLVGEEVLSDYLLWADFFTTGIRKIDKKKWPPEYGKPNLPPFMSIDQGSQPAQPGISLIYVLPIYDGSLVNVHFFFGGAAKKRIKYLWDMGGLIKSPGSPRAIENEDPLKATFSAVGMKI